jgi:hypothetical protein
MFVLDCAMDVTTMELAAMKRTTALFPSRRFAGTRRIVFTSWPLFASHWQCAATSNKRAAT